jgi:hypothetical protein
MKLHAAAADPRREASSTLLLADLAWSMASAYGVVVDNSGLNALRAELSSRAPDNAVYGLFVAELAIGRSDSDWPNACGLWGFELDSGDRLQHHPAPYQLPSKAVTERFNDEDKKFFIDKYHAAQANPPRLYQGRDMNEWLYEVEAEVLEALGSNLDDPEVDDKVFRFPEQFEWDGDAGQVEASSPSGAGSNGFFPLWRLKLTGIEVAE